MLEKKLFNVGFASIKMVARSPFGLDVLARYPLFPPEFLDFLKRVVPPERHGDLVYAVVLTARKPF